MKRAVVLLALAAWGAAKGAEPVTLTLSNEALFSPAFGAALPVFAAALEPEKAQAMSDGDWRRLQEESWNGKPLPEKAAVCLCVLAQGLNAPDLFKVAPPLRKANAIHVETELRAFGGWDTAPELRAKNKLRNELHIFPLGVLAAGEYEVEVGQQKLRYGQIGLPEKATPVKARPVRPEGPPRWRFWVGRPVGRRLLRAEEVIPGRAHRSFHFSGLVHAGHVSGDLERPFVHLDHAWATREHLDALWRAASALDLDGLVRRYPQGKEAQSLPRYVALQFAGPDGALQRYVFPTDAPELAKVRELINKESYGAW